MIVLGIETSCDETATALVGDDRRIIVERVLSQIAEHRPFGELTTALFSHRRKVMGTCLRMAVPGLPAPATKLLVTLHTLPYKQP